MKEKKNIIIVVLILLLGVSLVYIGYDKLMSDKDNNIVDKNENCNNNYVSDFYTNLTEEKGVQLVIANKINFIVDKKGDAYFNLIDDDNYQLSNTDLMKKEYPIEGYIKEIGNDSNIFEGYKVDISNIVNAYFSYVGNDGTGYVFLIKKDGTVGCLAIDILYSNQISVKLTETIPNLKNVVSFTSIYHVDGEELCFVDIDGHILSASNYKLK